MMSLNIVDMNVDSESDKFSTSSDKSIYHELLSQMSDEEFTMSVCSIINNVDNNDEHKSFALVNDMSSITDFYHEQSIINW